MGMANSDKVSVVALANTWHMNLQFIQDQVGLKNIRRRTDISIANFCRATEP